MYISTSISRPADRLHELELRIVEGFVAHARRRGLTRIARAVTRAGNGWLYSAASALLLLRYGRSVAAAVALFVLP